MVTIVGPPVAVSQCVDIAQGSRMTGRDEPQLSRKSSRQNSFGLLQRLSIGSAHVLLSTDAHLTKPAASSMVMKRFTGKSWKCWTVPLGHSTVSFEMPGSCLSPKMRARPLCEQ